MVVIKRRLLFWLLKAYLKKWGKNFALFFILGLIIFFILLVSFTYFADKLFPPKQETIGIVGSYTLDSLPEFLLDDVSRGLTKINKDGSVSPDIATSWETADNEKTYIFHLRPNIFFSDGTAVTSQDIKYNFSDVTVQRPDKQTILFHLKDIYAPFLVTVSRKIFKNNFVGIGNTQIKTIDTNSGFIDAMLFVSKKHPQRKRLIKFYPTQESVKVAFALGEISATENINDLSLQHTNFTTFPHVLIKKTIDYSQLVSLFYNTQDKNLSDKQLRDALTYTLPNTFPNSERAHSPLSPQSWAYQADTMHIFDVTHAQLLLESAGYSQKNTLPQLTIATVSQYKNTAEIIAASWKKIGITTKITIVSGIPDTFQIYLGDFHIPKDPDQYTLWHSHQQNNITNYANLRIDKLLENGRKTTDVSARTKIYADFQKYIMDDAPASFLYFPTSYTIVRK